MVMLAVFLTRSVEAVIVVFVVQTYYYNARTRESAWSKPDNAKVITQADMEAMAASGQPLPGSAAGTNRSVPTSVSHTATSQGTSIVISIIYDLPLPLPSGRQLSCPACNC